MKKIIYGIGILFLAIVVILNVLFTAYLNEHENISVHWNSFGYILGLVVLGRFLVLGYQKVGQLFESGRSGK